MRSQLQSQFYCYTWYCRKLQIYVATISVVILLQFLMLWINAVADCFYNLVFITLFGWLFICLGWIMDVAFVWIVNRYAHDEESAEDQEETGWKYIHGDVFRFPKFKSLFAAALGSGTQLFTLWVCIGLFEMCLSVKLVLGKLNCDNLFFVYLSIWMSCDYVVCSTVFIFILALVGVFYPYNRGALFTALVVIYALTSGIAGYTATSFYCQLEGTNWVFACEFFSSAIWCCFHYVAFVFRA